MAFDPAEWDIDPTPLGSGYFAQVHRGSTDDGYLRRQHAAFKILRGDLDDDHADRFLAEMAVLADIRGVPYLANVLGAGRFATGPWKGRLYIAMELAEGSLAQMARGWSWAENRIDVLEACVQVATGLAGLHAAGFLHGDLKPDNVLYAARAWKLTDFNVSSALVEGSASYYGATPAILPPESNPLDGRRTTDDVWALGVLMAELVGENHPFAFDADVRAATVAFGRGGPGPDLSEVADEVRPVVERCLARDAHARPTAQRAADELMRLLLDARAAGGAATVPVQSAAAPARPEVALTRPDLRGWYLSAAPWGRDAIQVIIRRSTREATAQLAVEGRWLEPKTVDWLDAGPDSPWRAMIIDPESPWSTHTFGPFPHVPAPPTEPPVYNRLVAMSESLMGDARGSMSRWPGDVHLFEADIVDVTAGSADRGHGEVFALLADGSLHHAWKVDGAPYAPDGWSEWQPFEAPESPRLTRIGNAADHGGHLELLAVDADGGVWHRWLYHRWLHGGVWSEWASLDLTVPGAKRITGSSAARDHIEVFVLDGDGRPHHRWWWEHRGWSEWAEMPRPEPLVDLVSVAAHRLPLVLCAIGESGTIWWRSLYGDWTWSPWSVDLPPLATETDADAASP